MKKWIALGALFFFGCNSVPDHYTSPKRLYIDGVFYIACDGVIRVYSPSREIVRSSRKTYEITFSDNYGKDQDIKDVSSYTIEKADSLFYAMPPFTPSYSDTVYSNGSPIPRGEKVSWANGRAIYVSPGNWKPTPCSGTF